MADRDPPRPPGRTATTNAVLRLLLGGVHDAGDGVALLVARRSSDTVEIEDACPRPDLIGDRLRVPAGLIVDRPSMIDACDTRLALDWTQICSGRPLFLAAAPVPNRSLHVVAAGRSAHPIDLAALADAADLVGQLLRVGQMTGRERDASLRMTALIANLPVPVVFVDSRSLQVLLNDRARALLDLPADRAHAPLIADALARLVRGAGGDAPARLATDPTGDLLFEVTADGRHYQVETRWIDQDDLAGRIWIFGDVTTEKAFQARLSDLAGLLELTVENVSEGVLLVDKDGRIGLWNAAFVDLFDFPPAAMQRGAPYIGLVDILARRGELGPGLPTEIVAGTAEAISAGQSHRREIQRADGRILDARRTALAGGRFLLAVRDVTDEREAARFKDELIATVSHELRTPLTAIAGSLGLLKAGVAGPLAPQAETLVEVAHKNGTRLGRLVDDLLDMDKLSGGKLDYHLVRSDVRRLVEEAVEQNQPYARKFGVSVDLELPAEPVHAWLDPDRMQQVLSNLLSNAAKFSPEGSRVRVRLTIAADALRISVIDRGRGMSPEFRRRLFTRFAQENRSSERGQAGTGLGLAISKSIVEQHGGTIAIETKLGRGTSFHIDLPRRSDVAK